MTGKVCGPEPINAKDDDAIERIRAATHGRGADVCIDAVGMEADRSFLDRIASVIRLEKGTINAMRQCFMP